jgi:hypothetical protein
MLDDARDRTTCRGPTGWGNCRQSSSVLPGTLYEPYSLCGNSERQLGNNCRRQHSRHIKSVMCVVLAYHAGMYTGQHNIPFAKTGSV